MQLKNFSLLAHAPDLRDEILARSWTDLLEAEELADAAPYAAPGKLLNWETVRLDKTLLIEARFDEAVGGPTDTLVFLDYKRRTRKYDLDSECSCDESYLCKHAAAVLLVLAEKLEPATRRQPSGELDDDTLDWITCLENADDPPAAPKPAAGDRFLAYWIESDPSSIAPPKLHLHVGRRLKSGELRIDRGSHADADPLHPPSYMQEEDLLPSILYRRHAAAISSFARMWESLPIEGCSGHRLLTECLKTGRLFHVHGGWSKPVPVQAGDPVQIAPAWRVASDGSATPSLGLPDGAVLLPTSPLFALLPPHDSATTHATLHPVQKSSHPDALLATWNSGPSVSPHGLFFSRLRSPSKL